MAGVKCGGGELGIPGDDPQQDRSPQILLRLPAEERLREFLLVFTFPTLQLEQVVDYLSGELALRGFQQAEHDVPRLDGVRLVDELQETSLELNRDFFRNRRQILQVKLIANTSR